MIIAMDSLTATRFRCSRMYIAADGYHGSLVRVAQTVAGCESLLAEKQRIASSKTRIISRTKSPLNHVLVYAVLDDIGYFQSTRAIIHDEFGAKQY